MSIPLVQNNEKDSINTSIIAIKRNIERINMLLGLSNSEEIDTSKFATKEELQQAVTDLQPVDEVAVDNMHSVTSNAVSRAIGNAVEGKLRSIKGVIPNGYFNYREIAVFNQNIDFYNKGFEGILIIRSSSISNPTYLYMSIVAYKNDVFNATYKCGGNFSDQATNNSGTIAFDINTTGMIAELIPLNQ